MTTRRSFILFGVLLASALCQADTLQENALTTAQYRAELDRLTLATQQLDSSGTAIPPSLRLLPQSWRVRTVQREFEISTEGLQRDVRRYDKEKNATNGIEIRRRLQSLRAELDGFEKPPTDYSASRTELNAILARPEFRNVRGPTWMNRLQEWLANIIYRILRRFIRIVAIPNVSKFIIYGLMAVALIALAWFAYRTIWRGREVDEIVPRDVPISAKEWTIWLSEARAAAARGEWRDAIHLAYWAGISFLERQGVWKPDRARTPREYLRLLAEPAEQRETLAALTRIFELAWYAKREASERTFAQTLAELEKLGCQ
jgi:hypothetical protein